MCKIASKGKEVIARDNCRPKYIYLLGGINDMTKIVYNYDKSTRYVVPTSDNAPDLIEHVNDQLTTVVEQLSAIGVKLVICELVGIDLNRYNKYYTNCCGLQDVMDESIPHINRCIGSINQDAQVITPYLQSSIHHVRGNKRVTKYKKTS